MRLIDADALFEVIEKSMAENPHKEKTQRAMHIHEHKYFLTLLTTFPTIQPVATDTNVGDKISRQAAVELVMKYCSDDDGSVQCDGDIRELLDELENLPPVQPEKEIPKRVLWSGWKGMRDTRYKCPNCKKPVRNTDIYCHRCGQKLMFPNISFTPYVEGQKQELIVKWDDEEVVE